MSVLAALNVSGGMGVRPIRMNEYKAPHSVESAQAGSTPETDSILVYSLFVQWLICSRGKGQRS
jgi:hypothetical protein